MVSQSKATGEIFSNEKVPPDKSLQSISTGNNERTENLTVAKDRAQMTATTAMSVVHVALLKTVLDNGPEGVPYYYACLSLIITCLCLQVIIGALNIYITNLRNYYKKFEGDMCGDIIDNICCCKIVPNPEEEPPKKTKDSKKAASKLPDVDMTDLSTSLRNDHKHHKGDPLDRFRCLCCWVTTKVFDDYEYDILDLYEHWQSKMPEVEMGAVAAEEEIRFLTNKVVNARNLLDELIEKDKASKESAEKPDTSGDVLSSRQSFEEGIAEVKRQLAEAQEKRKDLENRKQNYILMTNQGDVLEKYAEAVKKKRVLKMVSFWQNLMNYLLYIVFILNAFITGLGMATQTVAAPTSTKGPPTNVSQPRVTDQ